MNGRPSADDHLPPHERVAGRRGGEPEEETTSFGRIGNRPLLSVRFCKRDGTAWSFAYAHGYSILADGRGKLVVTFSGHTVTVEGRNLGRVHDYLDAHRLAALREADSPRRAFADDAAEAVDAITVAEVKG